MAQSNTEIIAATLAAELAMTRRQTDETLDEFYATAHDQLRRISQPMPLARTLVECLLGQNLVVAIATNPLFPEAAVMQRLDWAGLADLAPQFRYITHSGNSHFIKPSPAYYAELAARVGVEPDEALMIGDNLSNDIEPARAIGIAAWHVAEATGLRPILARLASSDWAAKISPITLTAPMLKPQFAGNISALHGLLADSSASQWMQQPDPNEWSIMQILCHLAETEATVHQARLRTILAGDNPFIRAYAPPGPRMPPCHDDAYAVLQKFHARRLETLALLDNVSRDEWRLPARHSIFGMTTLLEMAYFTAQHDRLHINQLCQTLGKCEDPD